MDRWTVLADRDYADRYAGVISELPRRKTFVSRLLAVLGWVK